ncbi:MAG TPA: SAM-dependent methyltransferase, partial [Rhodanobacter sp.]|nr:SAM-dependent methyltransferase [Rhodanobacter sp.]
MTHYAGPLLTRETAAALSAAHAAGATTWKGSLDLGRSRESVALQADGWVSHGARYPYPPALKPRSIHYWDGDAFAPV